jgi:hypothetical protein
MVQHAKEGTEAFDDPFPVGGRRPRPRRTFGSLRNWLSTFIFVRDLVFEDGGLGRPPLVWGEGGCRVGWTGSARSSRSGRRWA